MKYRDLLKLKKWQSFKRSTKVNTLLDNKLLFLNRDVRWTFFLNQWVRSGKRYIMNRVLTNSQRFLRSEYKMSPWLIYRSSLWSSRILLDVKIKKFGRKQMFFPIVVKGTTVYTRPMLYLRKLINTQKIPGLFWMKWSSCVISTSLGHGPIFSIIENKYRQLAKLQNIMVKPSKLQDLGKAEWVNRIQI